METAQPGIFHLLHNLLNGIIDSFNLRTVTLGICRIVRNDPAKILRQWNDKSDWVHTPPSLPRHFNASPKVLRTDDWNINTKITRGGKNLKKIGKIKWTRLDQKRGDPSLRVQPSLYSVEGRGVHPLKTFIASLDLVYNRRRCFGMEESRGEWNLNANRPGWIDRIADAERGGVGGKISPVGMPPLPTSSHPTEGSQQNKQNFFFYQTEKKREGGDIPPPSDTLLRTSSNDGMDEK